MKQRLVFTFIMSGMLSFLMSLFITFVNLGPRPDFFEHWIKAYSLAWPAAFVCALLVSPFAQRITQRIFRA